MNDYFKTSPQLKEHLNALSAIQGHAEALITYVADRPGHDRRYAIDAIESRQMNSDISQQSHLRRGFVRQLNGM